MATERQNAANRRNAAKSTGPKTAEGKARSRANGIKHGLTCQVVDVEAGLSPAFEERRAKWAAEQRPVGEEAEWTLDRAVASTFRIERCEQALENYLSESRRRAMLSWEEDRGLEAASTYARLAGDPVVASRALQTTLAGVVLLIEAWLLLVSTLEADADWSEVEASKALDLLGVDADLRNGQTMIDEGDGPDLIAFRKALAMEEVERLEALRDEALRPLDAMERLHAESGHVFMLSKRAKLLLRYEREAWRTFRESMKHLKAQAASPIHVAPAPPPTPAPKPTPIPTPPKPVEARPHARERTLARPRVFDKELRAMRAEAEPYVRANINRLIADGFDPDDEDGMLETLERRIEARRPIPGAFLPISAAIPGGPATDRTQFGNQPAGPATNR